MYVDLFTGLTPFSCPICIHIQAISAHSVLSLCLLSFLRPRSDYESVTGPNRSRKSRRNSKSQQNRTLQMRRGSNKTNKSPQVWFRRQSSTAAYLSYPSHRKSMMLSALPLQVETSFFSKLACTKLAISSSSQTCSSLLGQLSYHA